MPLRIRNTYPQAHQRTHHKPVMCMGKRATIVGTQGDDRLFGTLAPTSSPVVAGWI
jgi:hypothetical protein